MLGKKFEGTWFHSKTNKKIYRKNFPRAQVPSFKVEHDFFTFNAINLSKFLYLYLADQMFDKSIKKKKIYSREYN